MTEINAQPTPPDIYNPASTAIVTSAYYADTGVCDIVLMSSPYQTYHYVGVSAAMWDEFKLAPSAGDYYRENIRPLPFTKSPRTI